MSITSLILALLPAIVARPKPDPDQLALEAGYVRLSRRVALLTEENARLRAENDILRNHLHAQVVWTETPHYQLKQNQNQLQLAAQQQAQQLLQYQNGLEHFCNCAPDRASRLARI